MQSSTAQILDTSHKIDTLTIAQRTSIRTNGFDWIMGMPNIGVEFDINNKNWNRWAVNASVRWRPATENTYAQPFVYNYFEARLEGRMYWRERQVTSGGYLRRHTNFWDRIWSCRTKNPSHPKTVFYRGGYISYADYSFLFYKNATGRQGNAIMAGFTWGFVNQLYQFRNNTSLDLEFGASIGPVVTKYQEYTYNSESSCYPQGKTVNWKPEFYPVINDIHVALVYRIGKYPLHKKYRWRYDVDLEFRDKMDSLALKKYNDHVNKLYRDSIYEAAAKDYKFIYDSLFDEHIKQKQIELDKAVPARDTVSVKDKKKEENNRWTEDQKKRKENRENRKPKKEQKPEANTKETEALEAKEGGEQ